MSKINQRVQAKICVAILGLCMPLMALAKPMLQDIKVSSLPGNRILVQAMFDKPPVVPKAFTIQEPARVIFDFMGAGAGDKKDAKEVNMGLLKTINHVTVKDRLRMVLGLVRLVDYKVTVSGNTARIELETGTGTSASKHATQYTFEGNDASLIKTHRIDKVDFKRSQTGGGQIIVDLSDANTTIDVNEKGSKLHLTFLKTQLPAQYERKLNVLDFGTPVKTIETYARGDKVFMNIEAVGDYDQLTYQTEKRLIIEYKPLTVSERQELEKKHMIYKGERLSLNFQDIATRTALNIIADYAKLNLVASDRVRGNITLRLHNVPWDQALAIILRTSGLDKRQAGNVLIVAPADEIARYEKKALENQKQVESLAPLRTQYIQINYAKASDIASLLQGKGSNLLTKRGSIAVDERTNILLVQETAERISQLYKLIDKIDVPVRQVLIDARLVTANKDFERDLGIKWGAATQVEDVLSGNMGVSGNVTDANGLASGAAANADPTSRFNINLPSTGVTKAAGAVASTLGVAFAKLAGGTLLDLELSALEAENRGKLISSPRLVTANQKEATIERGSELPYNEASSSGASAVAFKKAVLSLTVKPLITPDDRIILDLTVTQDKQGTNLVNGNIPIDTNKLSTQVLVDNGQTVVLGGVFEETKTKNVTRVPFFGQIPVLGALFRRTNNLDSRQELLIFVTPKILSEQLAQR